MRSNITKLITALLLAGGYGVSGAAEICHVANAGFVIKGETVAVLIDGLMEEDVYEGRFALPSAEALKAMNERTGDYQNLSLVLATHRHGDHFDPKATIRHLRTTSEVHYVLPAEALAALEANGLRADEQSRITFIEDSVRTDQTMQGVRIESFDVEHGEGMPQNIGYRVTVDGVSFFHTGDINATREQLAAAGITGLEVDVLIMPFWYTLSAPEQLAAVKESWTARIMMPTHFNPTPPAWMARFGGLEGVQAKISAEFDKTVFLTEEGACETIEPGAS